LGCAYDPVSLFLLELFRYLEKFPDMKAFVEVMRDREKGKHYRLYAGIKYPHLPCEGTFTNLKDRLGEELYNHILHVLVEIAERLGFLSYKIIATDGTFFPPTPVIRAAPISVVTASLSSLKALSKMSARESFIGLMILRESSPEKKSASKYHALPPGSQPIYHGPKWKSSPFVFKKLTSIGPVSSTRSSLSKKSCNGPVSIW